MTGYRKLIATLAGILTVGVLAWFDKAQPATVAAIGGMVTAYLAINLAGRRSGTSDQKS